MEGSASNLHDAWTVWESPGKPIRVRLSPDVVGRLGMEARESFRPPPGRGLETGGLLIGSRTDTENPVVIQVYDFEPVKSEHAAGPSYQLSDRDRLLLAARIAAHEATCKNSSIVGVYRSHTRPDFAITDEDASLFSTYFKNPSDVFLIIKPNDDGSSTGGFVIRERGEVVSKTPYVQFPLQRTVVRKAVREMPLPAFPEFRERPPAEPIVPQPAVLQSSALRGAAARAAFWLPAVGVIALAVGLYWGIRSSAPGSIPGQPPLSPALNVAFIGDSLKLSWDHQISRRANRALLWIKDGPETLRLELDSKLLSEGSVAYRPKHSDVEFRLETLSPGAHATASVRAIGGPSQTVAARPVPATVAVAAPRVPSTPLKTPLPKQAARPVSAPNRPRPNPIGTASRQVSSASVLSREEPTPTTAAAVSLPDPPAIHPVVAPPPLASKEPPKPIASANRPVAAALPFQVSVEPVPASRRSFPAILKRSPRSDYVPPAVLRDPGLLGPPHRGVAGNVNIDVKVYVNPSGKVDYSEVLSEVAQSNRDLATLAVFSARRWEFVPARTKDGAVAGEVIIHYRFGPWAPESGSGNLTAR